MNVYAKQKQTHRYGKQTCGRQGGKGKGQKRGMGLTYTDYYI